MPLSKPHIRAVLALRELTYQDIADQVGCNKSLVTGFVNGYWGSAKVRQALLDIGVAEKHLPEGKRNAA